MRDAKDFLRSAAMLLSEDGENEEYDRAIVELTCAFLGVSTDLRDVVFIMLSAISRGA